VLATSAGLSRDISFWPFSLYQVHVGAGEPDVWDDPGRAADLLAMQVGVAVRNRWPERFHDVHLDIFAARHDRGLDLRDENVVRDVLAARDLDPDEVLDEVAGGKPLEAFRAEHDYASDRHEVFGVPTFVVGDAAVFIRIMSRPEGNVDKARTTIERLVGLVEEWPALNELKHTRIPR
jgi:hypothetical protein